MEEMKKDHIVFVGTKPFMNYVTSIAMQFTIKQQKEVVVKARGKFISRAVDIVEAVRKRFLKDKNIGIKEVKIDSEELENRDGKKTNVSAIEIVLVKSN